MDILTEFSSRNMTFVIRGILSHLGHADIDACRKVSAKWKQIVDTQVIPTWDKAKLCR